LQSTLCDPLAVTRHNSSTVLERPVLKPAGESTTKSTKNAAICLDVVMPKSPTLEKERFNIAVVELGVSILRAPQPAF